MISDLGHPAFAAHDVDWRDLEPENIKVRWR